jgi:PEP-CTERM motif
MRTIPLSRLAAAAVLAITAHAQADTGSFSGFANGSQSVNFSLTSPNVAVSGSASAGGFLMSYNSGTSFETYCVDLYQHIAFGETYTDYGTPGTSHTFANANAYTDLSRLYARAGVVNNSVTEAAFQIAVWEIAYETTGAYNLGLGSATFGGGSADSSGALTLASTWLSTLGAAGPGISVIESSGHQDMIYAPVPEPETYALLLGGLGAMGFVARRRRV